MKLKHIADEIEDRLQAFIARVQSTEAPDALKAITDKIRRTEKPSLDELLELVNELAKYSLETRMAWSAWAGEFADRFMAWYWNYYMK